MFRPQSDKRPLVSVLIPVHNESATVSLLQARLQQVTDRVAYDFEFVFVDDGSGDGTVALIRSAQEDDERIRLLRLSRNFGKEAAVSAGLRAVRGDAVILIDADLQDPPEEFPRMLQAWQHGYDIVNMQRRRREGEALPRRTAAWLFYRILNTMSDGQIPNDIGDFRLFSRKAVDALNKLPERNRYMKGLFAWIGFGTTTLQYDRAPRIAGESKWSYTRLLGLAIDAFTSFSVTPLRLVTLSGATTALISLLFGLVIILKTLLLGEPVRGYTSLVTLITFLGGVQLLAIGIIGEYIGKVYIETKLRPLYLLEPEPDPVANPSVSRTNPLKAVITHD